MGREVIFKDFFFSSLPIRGQSIKISIRTYRNPRRFFPQDRCFFFACLLVDGGIGSSNCRKRVSALEIESVHCCRAGQKGKEAYGTEIGSACCLPPIRSSALLNNSASLYRNFRNRLISSGSLKLIVTVNKMLQFVTL